MWESSQRYALILFGNACMWARFGRPDLLWTVSTWQSQTQSGTEHSIFDQQVSSAKFIAQPTTNRIVTLEIK